MVGQRNTMNEIYLQFLLPSWCLLNFKSSLTIFSMWISDILQNFWILLQCYIIHFVFSDSFIWLQCGIHYGICWRWFLKYLVNNDMYTDRCLRCAYRMRPGCLSDKCENWWTDKDKCGKGKDTCIFTWKTLNTGKKPWSM